MSTMGSRGSETGPGSGRVRTLLVVLLALLVPVTACDTGAIRYISVTNNCGHDIWLGVGENGAVIFEEESSQWVAASVLGTTRLRLWRSLDDFNAWVDATEVSVRGDSVLNGLDCP